MLHSGGLYFPIRKENAVKNACVLFPDAVEVALKGIFMETINRTLNLWWWRSSYNGRGVRI